MKYVREKIKNGAEEIKKEVRQRVMGYMLAAFGLVAALAWNDAIRSFIEYFFPINKNTVLIKFVYAIIITFIVVMVSVYLTKLLGDKKEEK